jgi:hypothetical protein
MDPSKKSTTNNPTVEKDPTAETATVEYKEGIMTRVTKIPTQRTVRSPTVETATMEEDPMAETATVEYKEGFLPKATKIPTQRTTMILVDRTATNVQVRGNAAGHVKHNM